MNVRLFASTDTSGITLNIRKSDLYINSLNGHPFGKYSDHFHRYPFDDKKDDDYIVATSFNKAGEERLYAIGIDEAIDKLKWGTTRGGMGGLAHSLVTFCVAESLRFDAIATAVEQLIKSSCSYPRHGRLIIGDKHKLHQNYWGPIIRSWGQASEDVFKHLSPETTAMVLRHSGAAPAADRPRSAQVDALPLDPDLVDASRKLLVLKRPQNEAAIIAQKQPRKR
ncbi:hypothetical protein [Burkholderia sp. F1]|uniref:hypothetical protein n=1 Tax=Burkholderia sp. F1 TaxID=3366817 RepID=UPI003D74DD86